MLSHIEAVQDAMHSDNGTKRYKKVIEHGILIMAIASHFRMIEVLIHFRYWPFTYVPSTYG